MGQETPREPSEEDKSLNERPESIDCSGSCDMGLNGTGSCFRGVRVVVVAAAVRLSTLGRSKLTANR
jgi:hypothetical protein